MSVQFSAFLSHCFVVCSVCSVSLVLAFYQLSQKHFVSWSMSPLTPQFCVGFLFQILYFNLEWRSELSFRVFTRLVPSKHYYRAEIIHLQTIISLHLMAKMHELNLQDERNQLLTTNLWLNLVGFALLYNTLLTRSSCNSRKIQLCINTL